MGKPRKWAAVALVASLAIVAAACSSDDDGGGTTGTTGGTTGGTTAATGASGLSGTIVISGSSTVLPISSIVAETFNETNPDVSISVDGPGTGDGFALFCDGETDISDASRPIEQEEADACAANGIEYTSSRWRLDGITVMTNPDNSSIECLNKGDLYALFGPESEGFANWSDANDLAAAGRRERRLPRRAARDHGAGHGVRHLRRVHRAVRDRGHRARAGRAGGRGRVACAPTTRRRPTTT